MILVPNKSKIMTECHNKVFDIVNDFLFNNTLVSVVVMIISAIVLWGFDMLASGLVHALINIAG